MKCSSCLVPHPQARRKWCSSCLAPHPQARRKWSVLPASRHIHRQGDSLDRGPTYTNRLSSFCWEDRRGSWLTWQTSERMPVFQNPWLLSSTVTSRRMVFFCLIFCNASLKQYGRNVILKTTLYVFPCNVLSRKGEHEILRMEIPIIFHPVARRPWRNRSHSSIMSVKLHALHVLRSNGHPWTYRPSLILEVNQGGA